MALTPAQKVILNNKLDDVSTLIANTKTAITADVGTLKQLATRLHAIGHAALDIAAYTRSNIG